MLAGGWSRPSAIHNKECRAALLTLKRAVVSNHAAGHNVLSVGDNLSEILSTTKGRARDRELNSLCRGSCALSLSSDVGWRRRHIESARNFADADSRLADAGLVRPGEVIRPREADRRVAAAAAKVGRCRLPRRRQRPTGRFALELFSSCGRWSGALLDAGLRPPSCHSSRHPQWCRV